VNIVIEPFDEAEDTSPASESHEPPGRSRGTITPIEPVRGRQVHGSAPSAAWIVAGIAVASALAALVAIPVHDGSGSTTESTAAPGVVLDRVEPPPATTDQLIVHPVLAAACHFLFDVAADALATEPDTYARAALTVSGTEGRSLNDVVHDDLAAVRDKVLRLPLTMPGSSATRVEALDLALALADAAPCSLRHTPARQPSSWSITEAP